VKWFAALMDIHQQKTENERLEAEVCSRTEELQSLVEQKKLLLQEVHHRVKNNLQVMSSLLSMQAKFVNDPKASAALQDSERRVMAISMVYERLYRNDRFEEVDFGDYVTNLTAELFDCMGHEGQGVVSRVDVSRVVLDIDQAIPCGLILNELATNALKYAYPGGVGGEVLIECHETAEGLVRMRVSDQGIGLPPEMASNHGNTLGLKIVGILTKQLQGQLSVGKGPGAVFCVEFRKRGSARATNATASNNAWAYGAVPSASLK
jgi:two-component sensor histidine kinase